MGKYSFALFPNDYFFDIRPYQYGWEECVPLHSFGPSVRNHYLFHYIIKGRGILSSHASSGEAHEYTLEANQGFLICPGQVNMYTADKEEPWKYVWIEFDGLRAKECLFQAGLEQDQPVYQPRCVEDGEKLRDQLLYFTENPTKSSMHLVGRLSLFLDDLVEFSGQRRDMGKDVQRDFYIKEAVLYIQQNYHREITMDEVADFCKLSRSYFSRKFKESMGCTPQEFLIHQRLTNAAKMIRSTDLPINIIAARCGYPNQFNFSQAFKKCYGVPPREWRKKNESKVD